jgi:hypothetical protein
MSTMSRHCQNRVQRLRDCGGDTPWSSGGPGVSPRSTVIPVVSDL